MRVDCGKESRFFITAAAIVYNRTYLLHSFDDEQKIRKQQLSAKRGARSPSSKSSIIVLLMKRFNS